MPDEFNMELPVRWKGRIEDLKQPVILLTDLMHLPRTFTFQDLPDLAVQNDLGAVDTDGNKKNKNTRATRDLLDIKFGQKKDRIKVNNDEQDHRDDCETARVIKTNESLVYNLRCEVLLNQCEILDRISNRDDVGPKTQLDGLIFMCTMCDMRFKTEQHLERHLIFHEDKVRFDCTKCRKFFNRRHRLVEHYKKNHSMTISMANNSNQSFICDICDVPYNNEGNLIQHIIKSHVPRVPFSCKTCGMPYLSKSCLEEHLKKHANKKKFICADCSRSFEKKNYLKRHVAAHMNLRAFKCDFCGTRFNSAPNLKRHRLIHTGERPFKCTKCEASFTRKEKLVIHVQQIVCHKCQDIFYCRTNFDKHTAQHV